MENALRNSELLIGEFGKEGRQCSKQKLNKNSVLNMPEVNEIKTGLWEEFEIRNLI